MKEDSGTLVIQHICIRSDSDKKPPVVKNNMNS